MMDDGSTGSQYPIKVELCPNDISLLKRILFKHKQLDHEQSEINLIKEAKLLKEISSKCFPNEDIRVYVDCDSKEVKIDHSDPNVTIKCFSEYFKYKEKEKQHYSPSKRIYV